MLKQYCCRCGHPYSPPGPAPGFNEVCEACGEYLHACESCTLFDRKNRNCTDPSADPVRSTQGKNYCEQFLPLEEPISPAQDDGQGQQARQRLEDLFRDPDQ